jgi:DNA-damage-inducible protein D
VSKELSEIALSMSNIKLFESKKVRTYWDEKEETWYLSVIDVVDILTYSLTQEIIRLK